MTIEEVLRKLQEEHGDTWPQGALNHFLFLQAKHSLKAEEMDACVLLYHWTLEMIEAGVAFKQPQE